jgi:threonine/homoserine/homoserine lactone efflux protein
METLLELAVTSFVVGFTGAMMPGPVLIATILQSVKRGYVAGPLVTLGHALVELIMTILLVSGLALIVNSPEAFMVLGVAGGVTLLWMGVGALRYSSKASMEKLAENRSSSRLLLRGPISLGLLMSVSNPYWWVWWVTVGNTFLLEGLAVASTIGVVVFYFSHIMSDFTWYTFVSSSLSKTKTRISDRTYKYLLAGCAVALVAIGLVFIADGMISASVYI